MTWPGIKSHKLPTQFSTAAPKWQKQVQLQKSQVEHYKNVQRTNDDLISALKGIKTCLIIE